MVDGAVVDSGGEDGLDGFLRIDGRRGREGGGDGGDGGGRGFGLADDPREIGVAFAEGLRKVGGVVGGNPVGGIRSQ